MDLIRASLDKAAKLVWQGCSITKRKDGAEWTSAAKRDASKQARSAQSAEWIAEGKLRHWH